MSRPVRVGLRVTFGLVCALTVALGLLTAPAANAAPAAPGSLSPNGGSQSAVPTLQWARVGAAVRYDLQVSDESNFSRLLVSTSTTNRRYTPAVQLPGTTIYWRVKSVGSDGSTSGWRTASFARSLLAGPTLQSPADGAILNQPANPPVLSWNPVPNATGYEVMIDNDTDFIGASTATTSTTSYLVPDPQPATSFYWRVRAMRGPGLNTHWSQVRSYSIGALPETTPTYPLGDQQLQDVVFDWDPVAGARDYELRVSTDEDFNTLVGGRTIIVKGTRYSPPTSYNNDEYWWQVRARDNASNSIPWTEYARVPVHKFQRQWPQQPQLLHPADGTATAVADPFHFQWTPARYASRYQLDMGTDPNFSPGTFNSCHTRATTLTPAWWQGYSSPVAYCTPAPGVVYYWRVRALDEPGNINGIYSPIRSFVYNPGLVQQVSPADGATVAVPTLRWQASRDAERYHVVVRNNAGTVVADVRTYALSWTPNTVLDAAKGPYRWVVTSIDLNGHESKSLLLGSQWTFNVTQPVPTTGAAPLTPLSGVTETARFPELRWEPHPDAAYYKVYVSRAGANSYELVNGRHAYPVFTDTSAKWMGTGAWDWIVEAYRADNSLLGTSPAGRFRIVDLSVVSGHRVALTGNALADNACTVALDAPSGPTFCDDLLQTPVLDWAPVPEASHYLVYVFRDRELTNPVYGAPHYIRTQTTRWTPLELLADSQAGDGYFWFVRPCKADGICAPDPTLASHAFDKRSMPIDLVSPADGATRANEVVLTWQDNVENLQEDANAQPLGTGTAKTNGTVEARQYRVQISDDPTFVRTLVNDVVDQTTYTPYSVTLPEGPLYWRVQAIDGSGNSLTWSPVRSINKQSPAVPLVSPAHGSSVTTTPFFRWQPQTFAGSYQVEVYDDNDTTLSSVNRVISATSKQAAYTLTRPLPATAANYLWRVRRLDADGRPGPWSGVRAFKVTGQAPSLLSPVSGGWLRGNETFFSWGSVVGAAQYRFERRAAGSAYSSEIVTTFAQSWAPTQTLADGRYEWRVTSLDSLGQVLGTTAWRAFNVDSTKPTVTRRLPAASPRPPRDTNWSVTFSEPVLAVNGTTMRLYRSGNSTPVAGAITSSNGGRTWTFNPTKLLAAGATYTLKLSSGIRDRAGNTLTATSYSRTIR